jgi:hypothetical protein
MKPNYINIFIGQYPFVPTDSTWSKLANHDWMNSTVEIEASQSLDPRDPQPFPPLIAPLGQTCQTPGSPKAAICLSVAGQVKVKLG